MSGIVDPRPAPAVSRPFLVGREREQARLRQALDLTLEGVGSLALVSGEAGIGKTTLVEDLAWPARECGALVLSGGCYDLATAPPYGPWIDALGGYVSNDRLPLAPPGLLGFAGRQAAENPAELFRKARNFLEAVSSQTPLILILEDLHWADHSSLDLLREVARRVDQLRILLIATWRVDELNRRHQLYRLVPALVREAGGLRIDLRPLDRGAQRALIAARYRLSPSDGERLASYLYHHVDGNPFFLTELLRTLEEESLLTRVGSDQWQLGDLSDAPVPELVRQVIDARVMRLGDDARDMLERAAVIGHEVPLDLWTELTDVDDFRLRSVVERIVDARVLYEVPPNSYRFSHALVREAIYDSIVLPKRQAMHRDVAERLMARSTPDPDLVAYHLQQAADPRIAAWMLRAGEHARQQFAPRAAIDRFTSALTVADGLSESERIQAHLGRGRAHETLGDMAAAVADAEAALSLARKARNWRLEWQTLLDLGAAWAPSNYEQTGAYYRQALELARTSGDQTTLAVSLNGLGNWCFNVLRPREALQLHQEALDMLEARDDPANLAQTHDCLAMSWWGSGDSFRAAEHWESAIKLFNRLGDRQRLSSSMVSSTAVSLVDFLIVAARPTAYGTNKTTRGLELAREIDWRPGVIFGLLNVARLQILRGEIDPALETLGDALDQADSIEHREWSAACWWGVGLARICIQDLAGARHAFEQGLSASRGIRSHFWTSMIAPSLAYTLSELGDLDAAAEILDSVLTQHGGDAGPDGTLHHSHHRWAEASLALASGDARQALALVDSNLAALPHTDQGVVPALSLLRGDALLALGRLSEACEEFQAARHRLAEFGERPSRLIACGRLANACQSLGRNVEAREAIEEAQELATFVTEHIGDANLRSGFERYVDDLLSQVHQRKLATNELSPREIEVLQLVAEGLTDIQVARRLFLSRRTVSSHLRSIYSKLGVSTRTAAARLAIEQDLI